MNSPTSGTHSPLGVEETLKRLDSDVDTFVFPDSTIDEAEAPKKVDAAKVLLEKMEAEKAFCRLFRTASDGSLVQVVRRREFPPLATVEMQKIRLMKARGSVSPMRLESREHQPSQEKNNGFRYPYWSYLPKRQGLNAPRMNSLVRYSRKLQPTHRRTGSLNTEWRKPDVILPQVKVRKRVPSIELLPQTGKDLGLDLDDNFAERFLTFSSQMTQTKLSSTPAPSTNPSKPHRPKPLRKKQVVLPEVHDTASSQRGYDPEDFQRERQMTDQAKAMFLSGAFAKYYSRERELADRDVLAWLKYY